MKTLLFKGDPTGTFWEDLDTLFQMGVNWLELFQPRYVCYVANVWTWAEEVHNFYGPPISTLIDLNGNIYIWRVCSQSDVNFEESKLEK